MATAQRTYIVTSTQGKRLVVASSQAQAIRHVVAQDYQAESADGLQVAEMMSAGIKLERASVSPENKDLFAGEQA
jgi:hypothetical protein